MLVRVVAVSANPADWHTMRADPFIVRFMGDGFLRPKHRVLGIDIAGRVESVGSRVGEFRPGDEIFGASRWGGFAEYVCVGEERVVSKPGRLSFEEAAAVPVAALTALQALRDHGRIRAGQSVLVNGASGGVGTFAVQIAKSFDTEVTGVCSTRNLELVSSLGADHVVDYTKEDFRERGARYDLILDAAAFDSVRRCRRALREGGVYVMAGGSMLRVVETLLLGSMSAISQRKMGFMMTRFNKADLETLRELLESGKLRPVIDRQLPLSETADALRYLETGRARGKVVLQA